MHKYQNDTIGNFLSGPFVLADIAKVRGVLTRSSPDDSETLSLLHARAHTRLLFALDLAASIGAIAILAALTLRDHEFKPLNALARRFANLDRGDIRRRNKHFSHQRHPAAAIRELRADCDAHRSHRSAFEEQIAE